MTEQEEIKMCLNCPLPECMNCMGEHSPPVSRKRVYWMIEIKRMSELGISPVEMGRRLGIHVTTIYKLRKELGIPTATRSGRPSVRGA